jgi:thiosulfate reductase cytochrome b subunit
MSGRAYLVAGRLRVWHWTNAALFPLLIATGVSLQFAGADDRLIGFDTARILPQPHPL